MTMNDKNLLRSADIKKVYELLIEGKISFDDADRWAAQMIKGLDNGKVVYVGNNESNDMDALKFLFGIDMIDDKGLFLHDLNQVKRYKDLYFD